MIYNSKPIVMHVRPLATTAVALLPLARFLASHLICCYWKDLLCCSSSHSLPTHHSEQDIILHSAFLSLQK